MILITDFGEGFAVIEVCFEGRAGAFSHSMRCRPVGETSWSSKSVLMPTEAKTISALMPNTVYEWEMRGRCGCATGETSAYVAGPNFTTLLAYAQPQESMPPLSEQLRYALHGTALKM